MFADPHDSLLQPFESLDLAKLISEAGEAVAFVDSNWYVRFCNDVYAQNLGLTVAEIVGRRPVDYAPQFERSIFFKATEHCLRHREPIAKIGFSTLLNRWLMVRVFPVNGGMLLLANDASESVVKQYQLAQQAILDPLTQLGNKLAMEQTVNSLLQSREHFGIVFLGLHRYKDVIDAHGYALGDMAMLELASTLQSTTEAGETLYRISSDEFAVVRRGQPHEAPERAAVLLDALKRPINLAGIHLVLAGCGGTVTSPENGSDYELLLKRAHLTLREAEKVGRGTIKAFRSDLELASKMRTALEDELRVALDGNQFTLLLQPKVSLATGGVVGSEALIRWAHPRRGLLVPGAFLSIAQDLGAMVAIDQWVLRQSLKYCAALIGMGLSTPISINLSVDSLADMYLAERVADALEDAGVPPQMLEVEIPEGALMHDVSVSAKVLAQLHAMGVRISIDDFGTGYSSFAYLAQFPVTALKIDRQFVNELEHSETSRKIVKGIIRLAHSLALEVVAEGAENDAQVVLLRKMKCDSVQGYIFGRPMPWSAFKRFATQSSGESTMDAMAI